LTLTISAASPGLFILDVPVNASYIQRNGVNISSWIYMQSPTPHIYFGDSLPSAVWSFIFQTSPSETNESSSGGFYLLIIKVVNFDLPIFGANVTIGNETKTTDVLGQVSFKLVLGEYNISAQYKKSVTSTKMRVACDAVVPLDFKDANFQYDPSKYWFLLLLIPFIIAIAFIIKRKKR
jgi:hypothetical protein